MHLGKSMKVLGVVALAAASSQVAHGAAARKNGLSGFSGTLSDNKNIKKQQLSCDPDSPLAGSTSVEYDPAVSHLTGFGFGPGYSGGAFVEVVPFGGEGQRLFQPINQFLLTPAGSETGYVQTFYTQTGDTGILPIPEGYTFLDHAGPVSVDTHFLTFEDATIVVGQSLSLLSAPPSVVLPGQTFDTAIYRIFADTGTHGGNPADYMLNFDEQGPFLVPASQIAEAVVQAPEPSGIALLGFAAAGLLRRRRALSA